MRIKATLKRLHWLKVESLDGFLVVVTSDGTILYTTDNISSHLGFNQVDLVHRCLYGIVHPDDHHELKVVLEHSLSNTATQKDSVHKNILQSGKCKDKGNQSRKVSFLCRMKCYNGTSTGFVKMHCSGKMRHFPNLIKSTSKVPSMVLFAVFRPFVSVAAEADIDVKQSAFWTKHELDLKIKSVDMRGSELLSYKPGTLESRSFYDLIHPDDLAAVFVCHKTLVDTNEIHTLYFRMLKYNGTWIWMHTRGKVIMKNSRKCGIMLTHCPIREEDSLYLQQEAEARKRYGNEEYFRLIMPPQTPIECQPLSLCQMESSYKRRWVSSDTYLNASQASTRQTTDEYGLSLHSPHGSCPSSLHQTDRHSPVYPSTFAPHRYQKAAQDVLHKQNTYQNAEKITPQMNLYTPIQRTQTEIYSQNSHAENQINMYQMLSHLPPDMYDMEFCRRQGLTALASEPTMQQMQYQMPLTPQMSPESYFPQVACNEQVVPCSNIPPSPPPSPVTDVKPPPSCMFANASRDMQETTQSISEPSPGELPMWENGMYHSYSAGYQGQSLMDYQQMYDSSIYASHHPITFNRQGLNIDVRPTHIVPVKDHVIYFGEINNNGVINPACLHGGDQTFPYARMDTTNPSISQKFLSCYVKEMELQQYKQAEFDRSSPLPPIGSFLEFLNDELLIPLIN
ncbi:aryl hydrocarbon receptor-like isoform X2 [Anneissia japonica]|uniref:aryl hydrocarbon receptor-like isoform X2 n=1 Tax=Anneissia japonica TaxID=1529436 RepID=UPI0014254DC3|nr:aryl hydrocarbon receptor-like isoform X2 [Anneissia japonica]